MGLEPLAALSQWPSWLQATTLLLVLFPLPGVPSPSQIPTHFSRLSPGISSSLRLLLVPWQTRPPHFLGPATPRTDIVIPSACSECVLQARTLSYQSEPQTQQSERSISLRTTEGRRDHLVGAGAG